MPNNKIWGVDSAVAVTEELFQCVKSSFGYPKYWGRYLAEVPNVSDGLTKEEITLIRNKGIKVMPLYNINVSAVGYEQGRVMARNAVFHARKLGIPENVVIFAKIEKSFEVDEAFIRAWVETILPTGFRSGFYINPAEGEFSSAYCESIKNNSEIAVQSILWSAAPEQGVTKESRAPRYNPASPRCRSNVWAWQYGIDAPQCPINTNLADRKLVNYLY